MNRYNNSVYYNQGSNSAYHRSSPGNFRRNQHHSAPQNSNFRYEAHSNNYPTATNFQTFSPSNHGGLGYDPANSLQTAGYTPGQMHATANHPVTIYHPGLTNHPY